MFYFFSGPWVKVRRDEIPPTEGPHREEAAAAPLVGAQLNPQPGEGAVLAQGLHHGGGVGPAGICFCNALVAFTIGPLGEASHGVEHALVVRRGAQRLSQYTRADWLNIPVHGLRSRWESGFFCPLSSVGACRFVFAFYGFGFVDFPHSIHRKATLPVAGSGILNGVR